MGELRIDVSSTTYGLYCGVRTSTNMSSFCSSSKWWR